MRSTRKDAARCPGLLVRRCPSRAYSGVDEIQKAGGFPGSARSARPCISPSSGARPSNLRQASRGERVINLTAKEYELLELFMRNPRQVLTRDMIFDRVWGYDFGGESNIIEVYVRYLRQKLESDEEPRLIHTVRGMGYVLREPV